MNACKKVAARLVAGISPAAQVLMLPTEALAERNYSECAPMVKKLLLGIVIAAGLLHLGLAAADDDDDDGDGHILAIQHDVPHISTVPAIEGEPVKLFAWERVRTSNLRSSRKIHLRAKWFCSFTGAAF